MRDFRRLELSVGKSRSRTLSCLLRLAEATFAAIVAAVSAANAALDAMRAEKTKDELKAQMHGQEETLEELKKTMHDMHAMLFSMHGLAHLSDEEENNVWLMSVLGDVVDMVTTKEIYDRLWLNYDADRNGKLDIHELAHLALDAIRRSGSLIDVRLLRHLSRLHACPIHTAHGCISLRRWAPRHHYHQRFPMVGDRYLTCVFCNGPYAQWAVCAGEDCQG
eukprot:COSAG06_NODE_23910_length_678_cov_1.046632_1_plen_221_part_10